MDLSQLPPHIFGMHDAGAEQLFTDAGKRAWIVITVQASDPPGDFSGLSNAGHGVIVRLNNGYGSSGTLPFSSQYDAFARACANFVAGSHGARIWVIGNETNLTAERPGNGSPQEEVITPARYAECFAKCRAAIQALPGHASDWVVPAPPGPWNNQTAYDGNPAGDWVLYFRDLLNECLARHALPDALALHTYTHDGYNADFVTSEDKFQNAPFQSRHYQFRAYQDFLSVVPAALRSLPVLITEAQALPWEDRDIGWIQRAYGEINAWNAVATNQPVQALCLFRWQHNPGDPEGWSISDRNRLKQDLRAALQNDYRVRWAAVAAPVVTKPAAPSPVPSPAPSPAGGLLPLDKARWFVEEAVRKLEAQDGPAARAILVGTVNPWFYASYPQHSADVADAQAHATARWYSEEATRRIEAGKLDEARQLLLSNVLPWLQSPGPRAIGILGILEPVQERAPRRKGSAAKGGPGVLGIPQPAKKRGRKKKESVPAGTAGVLGIGEAPTAPPPAVPTAPVAPVPPPDLHDLLLAAGDKNQILPFNTGAALQKRIFADGLVPNSAEFPLALDGVNYIGQRAEHLLTGEVRVYYAPTSDLNAVQFVSPGGVPGINTPFKGGNRITQRFGERPEYYQQFHLAGHEGLDLIPMDGDRDIYCVEGGTILRDVDVPGDPKVNAYGIFAVVYNRENARLWYYCHMVEDYVSQNQQVQRGDKIGRMGGTGNVQGDHLHMNVRPVDAQGLPLNPNNGYKGNADPEPVVNALNAAGAPVALRDALFAKAQASQSIAFNTRAALQRSMFADGFCPNSAEFNISVDSTQFVAQRGENLGTGKVRVYYAPTTNFSDVKFVER